MKREINWEALTLPAIVVIIILGVIASWTVGSYMEAKAYERVTGKHVSTWDAMFIDLRVQEAVK